MRVHGADQCLRVEFLPSEPGCGADIRLMQRVQGSAWGTILDGKRPGLVCCPPLVASICPLEQRELGFSIFILYKPKNSI